MISKPLNEEYHRVVEVVQLPPFWLNKNDRISSLHENVRSNDLFYCLHFFRLDFPRARRSNRSKVNFTGEKPKVEETMECTIPVDDVMNFCAEKLSSQMSLDEEAWFFVQMLLFLVDRANYFQR